MVIGVRDVVDAVGRPDGFHRLYAGKQAGATEIACDIRPGNIRDAILCSVSANATHGLRRTNLDKRRAVETLLNDPEWRQWTQERIALHCGVRREFVNRVKASFTCDRITSDNEMVKYTDRWGNEREMRTTNIGRRERVDRETGEILDEDEPDVVEGEYVDPSGPATFFAPSIPADKGDHTDMMQDTAECQALRRDRSHTVVMRSLYTNP